MRVAHWKQSVVKAATEAEGTYPSTSAYNINTPGELGRVVSSIVLCCNVCGGLTVQARMVCHSSATQWY